MLLILVQVLGMGVFSGQPFADLRSPGTGLGGFRGEPEPALGHPWVGFGRHGLPKANPGAACPGLGIARAGFGVHFRTILGRILMGFAINVELA